jgi:hypothetical protein
LLVRVSRVVVAGEIDMKNEKKIMLLLTIGIAAAGVVLFGIYAMWWGLDITVQASTVSNVLAPLLLVAGFIERAVEVVITPWRDPEADKRQAAIDNAKTDKNLALQKTATDSLNEYVGETTRYAFIVALMFGLVAAMVGMRALWPFLETNQHLITAFNGRCPHLLPSSMRAHKPRRTRQRLNRREQRKADIALLRFS